MKIYHNFVGIDIGKSEVVVNLLGQKSSFSFENSSSGFQAFLDQFLSKINSPFIVLETTGGYEQLFLQKLLDINATVHRANTRLVKHFIRSLGQKAKTDSIDAKCLAYYAFERHQKLSVYQNPSHEATQLASLTQRRIDLNQMLVQEKNRAQSPNVSEFVKKSCKELIKHIQKQLDELNKKIQLIIESNKLLQEKKEMLLTIPGIGNIIANALIALLPELGQLNRRKIASLCGLAPFPCESGQHKGYRRTRGGRVHVRNILFMAAMAACNSNSHLKIFYEKLIAQGKKKMVALTALMRKIIIIANAKINSLEFSEQHS